MNSCGTEVAGLEQAAYFRPRTAKGGALGTGKVTRGLAAGFALLKKTQLSLGEALKHLAEVIFVLVVHERVIRAASVGQFALAGVERGVFKAGAQRTAVLPTTLQL